MLDTRLQFWSERILVAVVVNGDLLDLVTPRSIRWCDFPPTPPLGSGTRGQRKMGGTRSVGEP